MNNDTFLIENYDIELAQDICKTIEEENIRNRAVANVLGAKISEKYFTEKAGNKAEKNFLYATL